MISFITHQIKIKKKKGSIRKTILNNIQLKKITNRKPRAVDWSINVKRDDEDDDDDNGDDGDGDRDERAGQDDDGHEELGTFHNWRQKSVLKHLLV